MSNTTRTSTFPVQYLVQFDRIGRKHNPPPLLVQPDNFDDLTERVYRYADTLLLSRDVDVVLEDGKVHIFAGFRNGGAGTYREVATLCRDENCGVCEYPETNTVVPMVDGGIVPEPLAVYCRRCGSFANVQAVTA